MLDSKMWSTLQFNSDNIIGISLGNAWVFTRIWANFWTNDFFNTEPSKFCYKLQYCLGSLYISGKLPTYPSPKATFSPKKGVSVDVKLGKG